MPNNNKGAAPTVVATWNANGIRQRLEELSTFLEEKDVSILLMTETFLKPTVKLALRGFQVFRKDQEGKGGGVAVFVRNNIPARQVDLEGEMEAVAVEVELSGSIQRFISAYLPPSKNLHEEDFRYLIVHPNTIIGGDWNAKNRAWGCRTDNQNGRKLASLLQKISGLQIHAPEDPTTVPQTDYRRGEILDIFLSFKAGRTGEVRTSYSLSSDHFPVILKLGGVGRFPKKIKRTNWTRFHQSSEDIPAAEGPLSPADLEDEARLLTRQIQELFRSCQIEVHLSAKNHLGLTAEEKRLIRQKNAAKKKWARGRLATENWRERSRSRSKKLATDVGPAKLKRPMRTSGKAGSC